jgi:hypothetical protein
MKPVNSFNLFHCDMQLLTYSSTCWRRWVFGRSRSGSPFKYLHDLYKKCNCIITIGSISITYGCKIVEFICTYFFWTSWYGVRGYCGIKFLLSSLNIVTKVIYFNWIKLVYLCIQQMFIFCTNDMLGVETPYSIRKFP